MSTTDISNSIKFNEVTAEGLMRSLQVDQRKYPEAPALRHFFNKTAEGINGGTVSELKARSTVFELGIQLYQYRLDLIRKYKDDFFDIYCDPADIKENALMIAAIMEDHLFDIEPDEAQAQYFGLDIGDLILAADITKQAFDMMTVDPSADEPDDDEEFYDFDGEPNEEADHHRTIRGANDEITRLVHARRMDLGVRFGPECLDQDDIAAENDNNDFGSDYDPEGIFLAHIMAFEQIDALEKDLIRIPLKEAINRLHDCEACVETFIDADTEIGRDLANYTRGVERIIEKRLEADVPAPAAPQPH